MSKQQTHKKPQNTHDVEMIDAGGQSAEKIDYQVYNEVFGEASSDEDMDIEKEIGSKNDGKRGMEFLVELGYDYTGKGITQKFTVNFKLIINDRFRTISLP